MVGPHVQGKPELTAVASFARAGTKNMESII
jgi:hypothetical protein